MRGDESVDTADGYIAGTTDPLCHTAERRALAHVRARLLGGSHRQAEVGRYRLLNRLGAGGMGVVWRALDPELDRHVAVKLVRPASMLSAGMSQRRLLREARSLARVVHPNIVRVFDVGRTSQGVFLAMELLPGPTLTEWVWEPQPWRDVVRLFLPVARGLAHAHDKGLVHRDIKPDNIMWAEGRLVLTDFGLAAARTRFEDLTTHSATSAREVTALTQAGEGLGTPAYMAPEQHDGQSDPRCDVYALCVVMWEALCGVPVFRADTMEGLREAKVAMRLPELPDDVPRWLRRTLRRGLQADPNERIQSTRALLAALQPPQRKRLRWAAAGLTMLAAVAGSSTSIGQRARPPAPPVVNAAPAPATIDPNTTAIETLALLSEVQVQAGDLEGAEQTLQRAQAWADAIEQPRAQLAVLASRGSWLNATGDLAGAEVVLSQAYFLAVTEQSPKIAVESASRLVHTAASRGDYVQAREWLGAGRSWAGQRPPVEASARLSNSEGSLLAAEGKFDEAAAAFEDAVWGWRDSLGPDHPHVALALSNLGNVLDWQGRFDEAIARHQEALRIQESQLGSRHPHTAVSRLNLGSVRRSIGDYQGALADYEIALEIHREAYGPRATMTAGTLDNIGDVLDEMGRVDEAIAHHQEAVDILEEALGSEHVELVGPLSNLGGAHLQAGNVEHAIATLSRARALAERTLGVEHRGTAIVISNLGHAQRVAGHPQRALELHQQALRIREAVLGPNVPQVARSLVGIGVCQLELDQPAQAVKSLERALAIRTESGVGPDLLGEVRFALARALVAAGGDQERANSLAHAAATAFTQAGDDEAVREVERVVASWDEAQQ